MPNLSVCLVILFHVCILSTLSQAAISQRGNYISDDTGDQTLENGVYEGINSEKSDDIGSRETRASLSPLWARILNRLGKTREIFVTSGNYPTQVMRTNVPHRYHAPPTSLAKFKRNEGKSSSDTENEKADSDLYRTEKHKKGLSINGALSSLADMLAADGHRRDHSDAMRLRHRLLVAGKR